MSYSHCWSNSESDAVSMRMLRRSFMTIGDMRAVTRAKCELTTTFVAVMTTLVVIPAARECLSSISKIVSQLCKRGSTAYG